MLPRHLLPFALLLLAASAQGMTPDRESAHGGGSCPEAPTDAAAEATPHPALAAGTEADASGAPAAAPAPAEAAAASRVKPGTRWHSFLPGMFK